MRGDLIMAGVVVIIGACLLVYAFTIFDDGPGEGTAMEYEDYMEPSKTILKAEGAVEKATIGETTYIHAKELGEGTVTYTDGTKETITVEKATCDLILMCGQSNAAYTHPEIEYALAPEPGTGFYLGLEDSIYGSTSGDFSQYEYYDFIGSDGALRVGDKGPVFAKTWYEETGHKAIWISLGMGGRVMAFWNEGNAAWTADLEIMTRANDLMPEGFDIQKTFFFWSQGESDFVNSTGYQNYITNWNSLYDRAEAAWERDIDHWYLAMGRYRTCGWVNDAFLELASQHDDVSIGSEIADTFTMANGLMRTDDLHYNQKGDNALAVSLARACAADNGYTLSRAPIYLQETIVRCDVDEAVSLGSTVSCRTVDGETTNLDATWESSPDTSAGGIYDIAGTSSSTLLLEGTPAPLARIYVGYIGFVDGLEYCLNADGNASVIGTEYTMTRAVVPETVEGYTVTEIGQYALNRMPWTEISVPDTVETLAYWSLRGAPKLETLHIGDGITFVAWNAITAVMMIGDTEITQTDWRADPSILYGDWQWDGDTTGTLYKVTP